MINSITLATILRNNIDPLLVAKEIRKMLHKQKNYSALICPRTHAVSLKSLIWIDIERLPGSQWSLTHQAVQLIRPRDNCSQCNNTRNKAR